MTSGVCPLDKAIEGIVAQQGLMIVRIVRVGEWARAKGLLATVAQLPGPKRYRLRAARLLVDVEQRLAASARPAYRWSRTVILALLAAVLLGGAGVVWGLWFHGLPEQVLLFRPQSTGSPPGVDATGDVPTVPQTTDAEVSPPTSAEVGNPIYLPTTSISPDNIGQLVELSRWGKGPATQVAWSLDGRMFAVASPLGVYLYDALTFAKVSVLPTPDDIYTHLAFAPDGRILAVGGWRNPVQLWRVSDGVLLRTLPTEHPVTDIAFAPDGQTLATTSFTNSEGEPVQLWQVADGTLAQTLGYGSSVAFAPDGQTLATGSGDGTVTIWQMADRTIVRTWHGHSQMSGVYAVAWSRDGQTLASAASDRTIKVWHVSDGGLLQTVTGNELDAQGMALSPNGQIVTSESIGGEVRLWSVADGTLVLTLETFSGEVNSMVFAPDGGTLASVAADGAVRLWRVSDGKLLHILERHTSSVGQIAFAPDGKTLASGGEGGVIRLWRVADGAVLRSLDRDWVLGLSLTQANRQVHKDEPVQPASSL